MQPFEAMKLAKEKGLDLVEISPTADPPVCKITDYGKYLYQANKKAHEQRKSSRGSQLKEVKFRPATAEHDYQVRKNQIIRFLSEAHGTAVIQRPAVAVASANERISKIG